MLTQKQENFCLNIVKGMTQRDSWIQAGYSSNYSLEVLDVNASRLAGKTKIKLRINELRAITASKAVMPVTERKERLSEIGREDIISKGTALRNPNISAIQELNKMDNIYTQPPVGDVVQTFVFVLPDGTRVMPRQLKEGKE